MKIIFDPAKRERTLRERGLDFADAAEIFAGLHATRAAHGGKADETRFITAGHLTGRMVVLVWTPRGDARHIMSMRHAHAKEQELWKKEMG